LNEQAVLVPGIRYAKHHQAGDRFDWEGKGMASGSIHLALIRVRELVEPWEFPYEARYGGCRSWVNLPEPPASWRESARPVLDDQAFPTLKLRLT